VHESRVRSGVRQDDVRESAADIHPDEKHRRTPACRPLP
jgi:hypothetical protein